MKNQNGISLIALIITIIVIIILAAIVIGGVFNTPRDARFAQFASDFDSIQTAAQMKYYELYSNDQLDGRDSYYQTAAELVWEVARGEKMARANADTPYQPKEWVAFSADGFKDLKITVPTYSKANEWALHTTTNDAALLCRLVYIPGFEKDQGVFYKNPTESVSGLNGTRATGVTTLALELDDDANSGS